MNRNGNQQQKFKGNFNNRTKWFNNNNKASSNVVNVQNIPKLDVDNFVEWWCCENLETFFLSESPDYARTLSQQE